MAGVIWAVFILTLFVTTERGLANSIRHYTTDPYDYTTDPTYMYCLHAFIFDGSVNTSGHIYSPKYGEENYPNGLDCYYEIHVPDGWRVKVTFKDLDIDPSVNCRSDKIDFYGEVSNRPLGIYCGSSLPRPIFSLKGEKFLKIAFHSDFMGSGRGYHIFYEASPFLDDCPAKHISCRNRNCVPDSKKCDGIDDCEDGTDEQDCGFPLVMEPKECGTPSITPKTIYDSPDRIVGGETAIPNSWPWQVSLQLFHVEPNAHFCGGTLINAQWVVTASHCVAGIHNPQMIRIHIGAHYKFKKTKYEQIRNVVKIIAYPDLEFENMQKFTFEDDLTLIKLNAPVKFNDGVQPACLPRPGRSVEVGSSCYATGWGESRGTGGSAELKQSKQIVQPYNPNENDGCTFNNQTQICVEQRNQSPCHGDSGGPLQCKRDDKWYVFGAASFVTTTNFMGGICTGPGAKTAYANIADKRDWMRITINKYS